MNITKYKENSDQELIDLLKSDDPVAFTEIYNRQWASAYQAAYAILKDEDTCMDVLQDVFVWLWNNRSKIEIKNLKAYLRTAVKFKMLNVIRDGKLRESVFIENPPIISYSDTSIEVKELKEMIDRFTESLPTQAQRIFHLSRNEHLSHKEIAEQMGISEKTVKNQINISLNKLRKSLGKMSFWATFI